MPRYEHKNFGDVQGHIYMKGVITSVDSGNDTAAVTIPGGRDGSAVPLFYHCSNDSVKRGNGAIEGAAAAFLVNDRVFVICRVDGSPVRIVGFVDGVRRCAQQFRITINGAIPEDTHTLSIVDSEETEFIVSTLDEDKGLTEEFSGVVWPAKIYLNDVKYYREDSEGEYWGIAARKPDDTGTNPWDTTFRCGIFRVEPGSGLPGDLFSDPGWEFDLNVRCSLVSHVYGGLYGNLPSEAVNFPWKKLAVKTSGYFAPCGCSHVFPGDSSYGHYTYETVGSHIEYAYHYSDGSCYPGVWQRSSNYGFYDHQITALSNICIVSGENGLDPHFGGARIQAGYWNVIMMAGTYDEGADEWSYFCKTEIPGETYLPGMQIDYQMGDAEGV